MHRLWHFLRGLARGRGGHAPGAGPVLPSADAFYERVAAEIQRARREESAFTLVLISVDDFPRVVHRRGALAGERLLDGVVAGLAERLRPGDVVGRLRTPVFGLLLPDTGAEPARILLHRIRSRLAAAAPDGGGALALSVGAVTWTTGTALSAPQLAQEAYQAMYEAQRDTAAGDHHGLPGRLPPRSALGHDTD